MVSWCYLDQIGAKRETVIRYEVVLVWGGRWLRHVESHIVTRFVLLWVFYIYESVAQSALGTGADPGFWSGGAQRSFDPKGGGALSPKCTENRGFSLKIA